MKLKQGQNKYRLLGSLMITRGRTVHSVVIYKDTLSFGLGGITPPPPPFSEMSPLFYAVVNSRKQVFLLLLDTPLSQINRSSNNNQMRLQTLQQAALSWLWHWAATHMPAAYSTTWHVLKTETPVCNVYSYWLKVLFSLPISTSLFFSQF